MRNKKTELHIRLDPETAELIDSLAHRLEISKTILIKNALKVYASSLKNGHIMTIKYKSINEKIEEKVIEDNQEKVIENNKIIEPNNDDWDEIINNLENND